jgi:ABC-type transport system involved in cytochrome bd biosynthesis fused ATPase/permease subunit
VVVPDEVTASVHLETASRVQGVVRRELQAGGTIVVSVAHRAGRRENVGGVLKLADG